jgi:hypothetical protein
LKLLRKAEQIPDSECASKAAELILHEEMRLLDSAPSHEEAQHLPATLKVRMWNSTRGGPRIYGLDQLMGRLEHIDASSMVLGYG